jgi:hypothetical protein
MSRGLLIEKLCLLVLSSSSELNKESVHPFEALVHFCRLHGITCYETITFELFKYLCIRKLELISFVTGLNLEAQVT